MLIFFKCSNWYNYKRSLLYTHRRKNNAEFTANAQTVHLKITTSPWKKQAEWYLRGILQCIELINSESRKDIRACTRPRAPPAC